MSIRADSIQWRVRWSCRAGRFALKVTPAPDDAAAAGGACPARGRPTFIGKGQQQIAIEATGPWRAIVEQEVETPLAEPPLAGMTEAAAMLRGRFRDLERRGEGTATVYRLPEGRLGLRLQGFETALNSDLYVWLSRVRRPRTTNAILARPYREIAALKATVGDQNYLLPHGIRAAELGSVVIWCAPLRIAYAVAPLERAS